MAEEHILGIWDGHDSGAAIVRGDEILYALNEERLSRRKLEIGFPKLAISAMLERLNLSPENIDQVAVSTADFAKTLTRFFPAMKEEYYKIRRRKKRPGLLTPIKKRAKYTLTEWPPTGISRKLTHRLVRKELNGCGLKDFELHIVDHHLCHATGAAYCSGFDKAAIITIDGIGDALSGGVSLFDNGKLERLSTISGKESLGIFFEHVTNLMNMRELEDEGKVMALSTYAYPLPDDQNPMLEWFKVDGLTLHARYGAHRTYQRLKELLWHFPSEQFAYMAQRTLEVKVIELVQNAVRQMETENVALAGGIFANIQVNRLIRLLPEVKGCFVFPHMGDGGLALGAALSLNADRNGVTSYSFQQIYFGLDFSEEEMETAVKEFGFPYTKEEDIVNAVGALVESGSIGLWLQGRMEFGPRALGARSIIAHPGREKIKDDLNLRLKRRVWYQPFCPSMLRSTAERIFEDFHDQTDPFMTNAYLVKEEFREHMRGVIAIDGTCRPQIVSDDTPTPPKFKELLKDMERRTGLGVILNTSFNLHGEPLVCSPSDALRTLRETKADYLVLGDFLVRLPA
ncbi:MAG: carbamoyltransferase C-terminal domain-containing protein [Planctomycetota bacterium]|jgi:carbamoyltransferase|nr:carbamoyltransferase C-terminal domain-containing protein [Planctomycetota bacterium]